MRGRRPIAVVAPRAPSDTLDRLLDAGGYYVMLIDSMNDAHTQIRAVMPHLVLVCMQREEEPIGCQVLSMLGMDRETSRIPVLTHLVEPHRRAIADADDKAAQFERRAVLLAMN